MPWPESLGLLLVRSDSRASQALRWSLYGLRASLQAALEEVSNDPGAAELRGLLAELDQFLMPGSSVGGLSLPVEGVRDPVPTREAEKRGESRLLPLLRAVTAEPRFGEILQRSPLPEGSDNEIWNDIQRLLLRVPPELAEEWRRRCLSLAAQVGARPEGAECLLLPLGRDEVIYPGLTGAIKAGGLRSVATAPLDPRIRDSSEPDLHLLAGVISACLWLLEHDSHLHHCLASVFRFGVPPLTGDQRQRYLGELVRLWEQVRSGAGSLTAKKSGQALKERLDLDEALHSLVYQPPADSGSWWGRLQARARDTLFLARDRAIEAGCPVHLQLLGGNFADISRLAPDSLQVDYGVPGEVAVCLRVWARIDKEELKGRVLYRSPREES
jgi:hypothetical protein